MKPYIITFSFVFITSVAFAQTQAKKTGLDLMRKYDPQSYSYYQYNDGIKAQGKQIAKSIAGQLDYYRSLSKTSNLAQLVNEFNSKMNNIDLLEQDLEKQATNYLNNQSRELGNQLNSGDYMGALGNVLGSIEGYSEIKKAEKELAAKRANLQRQKEAQMSEIYRKKFLYTKKVISQLRQQAAFAESKAEEAYFLESIDYVWCSYHSSYCDQPQKPTNTGIANKFVAQDMLLKQTAERKLKLYEWQESKAFTISDQSFYLSEGLDFFIDGAIAFAAKAASQNASAENYVYLARLQSNKSNILAFSSMLVAESINPASVNGANKELYATLKEGATREIDQALRDNNKSYLDAFLKAGLDKTIRFEGKSLLVHAIAIDNPDAVQLILNHYIEGLNQEGINKKIQKAIMLSAAQNSPNTIKKFIELGVPTEFTLGDFTPIGLAAKTGSGKALDVLLNNSGNRNYYEGKYANSLGMIVLKANANPSIAANMIENLEGADLNQVIFKLLENLNSNNNYYETISSSSVAKSAIENNPKLQKEARKQFALGVINNDPFKRYNNSSRYLHFGLIKFNSMPFYGDLIDETSLRIVHPDLDFVPLLDESLAYVAFYFNNVGVFQWLKSNFDLAKVTNKQGMPLAESMQNSGKEITNYTFEGMGISKSDMIIDFIDKQEIKIFPPPIVLKNAMGIDPISFRNDNGGTLFHSCIQMTLKYQDIGIINGLGGLETEGIDKTIKNSRGKTALDLETKNEEALKNIRVNSGYSQLDLNNSKIDRKVLKDWWKEIIQLLI